MVDRQFAGFQNRHGLEALALPSIPVSACAAADPQDRQQFQGDVYWRLRAMRLLRRRCDSSGQRINRKPVRLRHVGGDKSAPGHRAGDEMAICGAGGRNYLCREAAACRLLFFEPSTCCSRLTCELQLTNPESKESREAQRVNRNGYT